jgi:hypothetical protein
VRLFIQPSQQLRHTRDSNKQLGIIYPQTENDRDPAVVGTFARGIEEMGYQFIAAYDHVIGANPASPDRLARRLRRR